MTAYDLFTRRGIHAVGVDEVVQKAEVAKTTLYRLLPSGAIVCAPVGAAEAARRAKLVASWLTDRHRLSQP